jgi:hypothetical protein
MNRRGSLSRFLAKGVAGAEQLQAGGGAAAGGGRSSWGQSSCRRGAEQLQAGGGAAAGGGAGQLQAGSSIFGN